MTRYSTTVASIACLSCSGEIGQVEPGLLSLQLQPAAAVRLTELEYTVTHAKGYVRSGPVAIGEKQSFSFKVDTLPPALGYEVTALARGLLVKSNASTVCTGHAGFEIKTAQATTVAMTLQCDGVAQADGQARGRDVASDKTSDVGTSTDSDAGTERNTSSNQCPETSAVAVSPALVPVGQEALLSADVPADNDGPQPLTYRWSADSGVIATPSATRTRFRCDRLGTVDIRFSTSDGDESCDPTPVSISVTCTSGDCVDLTHCPNSQVRSGANAAPGGAGRMAAQGQAGHAGQTGQSSSSTRMHRAGAGGR